MGIKLLIGQEWSNRNLVKSQGICIGVAARKLATYLQVMQTTLNVLEHLVLFVSIQIGPLQGTVCGFSWLL